MQLVASVAEVSCVIVPEDRLLEPPTPLRFRSGVNCADLKTRATAKTHGPRQNNSATPNRSAAVSNQSSRLQTNKYPLLGPANRAARNLSSVGVQPRTSSTNGRCNP